MATCKVVNLLKVEVKSLLIARKTFRHRAIYVPGLFTANKNPLETAVKPGGHFTYFIDLDMRLVRKWNAD